MYCMKCGAQIPDNAQFCPSCGAQTSAPAQAPVPPVMPQQQVQYQEPAPNVPPLNNTVRDVNTNTSQEFKILGITITPQIGFIAMGVLVVLLIFFGSCS